MGPVSPAAEGVGRLPCAGGCVLITGPARVAAMLAEALSVLSFPSESLPALDVIVSPDARTAEGAVNGQTLWSTSLGSTPVATLLGQIVGTLTPLLTRLLFVHAGAVADGDRGMVIVGASGAGKTSTVAALLRRGARYLSDEVALLDPAAGVVLPFAIPMAIKSWTRRATGTLPPGRLLVQERGVDFWLPDASRCAPVRVDAIVLLYRRKGAPRLVPIGRAEALLALAEQASSLKQRKRVEEAFAGFSRLVRGARCVRLESAHPAADAGRLLTFLRASP